jgi:hypothetical protein
MRAMTNGTDSKDENEEAKPYGEGLWKDVRFWFDAILAVFGDLKELMHVGLTRSLAVKLCNWLWGVEGAVRRLIIAEALKRDPGSPADVRTKTDAAPATRASRKRRPSFRIFGFVQQGASETAQPSAAGSAKADLPAFRHIRFPADSLLSIGERPKRRRLSPARRLNPLDRRGLSRSDPDYWLWREEEDYDQLLLGRSPEIDRPARPRLPPTPVQERLSYLFFRADPSDWRRVEEEWTRVIPAPHLAARVFALHRVWEGREAAIARVAGVFRRWRNCIADIIGQPPRELAWPRHAKPIYRCREVEALVPRSHAELWRLDTS